MSTAAVTPGVSPWLGGAEVGPLADGAVGLLSAASAASLAPLLPQPRPLQPQPHPF
jgi:hypothetical protein